MKKLICILLVLLSYFLSNFAYQSHQSFSNKNAAWAQSDLSPLNILILDLEDVQRLIEEGDNKTAITILKSALGNVRKVKEFDKQTKKITEKRIKKGITLLKQNKNDEALALVQTAFNELEQAGLI